MGTSPSVTQTTLRRHYKPETMKCSLPPAFCYNGENQKAPFEGFPHLYLPSPAYQR
jgi:hypothetical protein